MATRAALFDLKRKLLNIYIETIYNWVQSPHPNLNRDSENVSTQDFEECDYQHETY